MLARSKALASAEAQIRALFEGGCVLPENVTLHLQQIVQETVNNALMYAQATTIKVDLIDDPDETVLRIVDDGQSFDARRSTAGYHGLDFKLPEPEWHAELTTAI